jgi:hypothetical protein
MWKAPTPTAIGNVPFACFTYGQPGHKAANCPLRVTAPLALTPARQAPAQVVPHKLVVGATRGCLTHLTA